jgi:hypothetical protein
VQISIIQSIMQAVTHSSVAVFCEITQNNEKITNITELLQRNIDILTIYDILVIVDYR